MDFLRAIVFFNCLVFFAKVKATLTPGQYPAVYNFGDSNSDTGGIAAAFFPPVPPNGMTFFKQPFGRDCDGRLIIDFIADRLQYPFFCAYLDSVGTNFRYGANFATGGALLRSINESWFERGMSPFPLDIQIEHFTQFKDRSITFYQLGRDADRLPVPEEFGKALYILDIGQLDIAYGFAAKQTDEQIISTFPDVINHMASAIQQLYQLGARNFWIHNTGPIGCLPITTSAFVNPPAGFLDPYGCIKSQNDVATEFNKQLKDKVVQLRTELAESKLTYVDIYAAKYGLISNATSLGFESPMTICCGLYQSDLRIPCGHKIVENGTELSAETCSDPLKVISWDGVHYSEAANAYVANQMFTNPAISDPPI